MREGAFLLWSSRDARERERERKRGGVEREQATDGCSVPGDIGLYLALAVHVDPPRTTK